ncbi:zinc-binding alcohol dehydrogenase family protein [Companilactobacillus keshanensis]|uniref:Zinc-binding alcohol dehydrogenase family protein n=1 Tax=Companilactobacillus keshanensis TaxID=2486003 RepID=A0ABW4BWA5_9LACO|nr:zinc-binding alcohol dehydrogenase family protein [Companilactobacillus keshanensis]
MSKRRVVKIEHHEFVDDVESGQEVKGLDLLVKVQAASINPADARKVEHLNPLRPKVVGYDGLGTILEKGEQVDDFEVGDVVYYAGSNLRAGSFQEKQLIDSRIVARMPKKLTEAQAVGFPLVSLTAYEMLFEKFKFVSEENANKGKKILIINGAGGVGSIASQLAKWAGLSVYATSSPKNFSWLKSHGVDHPIDYHADSNNSLQNLNDSSFDATVCFYDISSYLSEMIRLTKPFGHIGTIVGVNGPLDITSMQKKSLSFDWELMFTKAAEDYRVSTQGRILNKITDLIDSGILRRIDTETIEGINADNLNKALKLLQTGHNVGKITLVNNV